MTTLPNFIEGFGQDRLVKITGWSRQTFDNWVNMHSAPVPERGMELIALSNGLLTWQSIYEPFVKYKYKGQSKNYTFKAEGADVSLDLNY